MMELNEYEIDDLVGRLDPEATPNLALGARRLQRLVRWTNQNSDGWCYWQPPSNAAAKLQDLLQSAARFDPKDCTKGELTKACTPIKAFLTRRGEEHGPIMDDPPPEPRRPMSFIFNPESDLEVELVDRCIAGEYEVSVRIRTAAYDGVIVERRDRLMEIVLRGGGHYYPLATDDILSIEIH